MKDCTVRISKLHKASEEINGIICQSNCKINTPLLLFFKNMMLKDRTNMPIVNNLKENVVQSSTNNTE